MKSYNVLYENNWQIEKYISKIGLDDGENCFIRIHVTHSDKRDAVKLAAHIKSLLPESVLCGSSVSGVIYNGDIYNDETLISFTKFDNAQIVGGLFETAQMTGEQIKNTLLEVKADIKKAVSFLFFTTERTDVESIVESLNDEAADVTYIGGNAGFTNEKGEMTSFLFDDISCVEQGVSAHYIDTEYVLTYSNVVTGHDVVSDAYTVTKAEGKDIIEVNGTPVTEWVSDLIGPDRINRSKMYRRDFLNTITLNFSLVLDGRVKVSRLADYVEQKDLFTLHANVIKSGDKFKIGYISPMKIIADWQKVYNDLHSTNVESIFCYSCAFRKIHLQNIARWELQPFAEAGINGAFLMGEIGTKKSTSGHYNGACSFLTMAESDAKLSIDLQVLDLVEKLQEKNTNFIRQIKKHLKKIQTQEGKTILNRIVAQDESLQLKIWAKEFWGINGFTDFLKKQAQIDPRKICMLRMCNFYKILDVKPKEQVQKSTAVNLAMLRKAMDTHFEELKADFYIYDDSTMFFTADNDVNDNLFLKSMQALFKGIQEVTASGDREFDEAYKMVVTLTGAGIEEMSNRAAELCKSSDENELCIYEADITDVKALQNEFKMVSTLKNIIADKKIVPYFQGVFDTQENGFIGYEALMRLQRNDGKILYPKDFMQVAKKYKLYEELSLYMVKKVLFMFENRQETVIINLCAEDVESDVFQKELFTYLDHMHKTDNIVFEIVGIENFVMMDTLRDFVKALRPYGIKTSVDDVSFENFKYVQHSKIEFDFIKIHASQQGTAESAQEIDGVVQTIADMAEKMQIELVAKCVETPSVQKRMINCGVRYFQGTFFAGVISFDELSIMASKDTGAKNSEQDSASEGSGDDLFSFDPREKQRSKMFTLGGIVVAILAIISFVLFISFNYNKIDSINDAFLVEIATGLADKVSVKMDDAQQSLMTVRSAVLQANTEQEALQALAILNTHTVFDDIYICFGDEVLLNGRGQKIFIDTQELQYEAEDGEVVFLSPTVDEKSGNELFLISTPIYKGTSRVASLYGVYYLDNFEQVLDLKSFGGEAFFHLCEIDGTPLILSGNSNNLFEDGNMYTFISSLDIKNGHTAASLEEDMSNGNSALLKYNVNGESRSAVMVTVQNTPWCIVSIVQSEVTAGMVNEISNGTFVFTIIIAAIFSTYLIMTQISMHKVQAKLVKALEASRYLTNSLQISVETDALTRTYSRETATEKIAEVIAKMDGDKMEHALISVDVDNFKEINDTYGHQTGDIYLQEFSGALKSVLRTNDVIGRLGGDEFVVLLHNVGNKENTQKILERMFEKVQDININNLSFENVGISAGVMMLPTQEQDFETLSNFADKALYEAKNSGKNKFVFYSEK